MSSFSYRSMFSAKSVFLNSPLIYLQSPTQRRIEKAEILEYTVLFLQNSVAQAKKAKDVEGAEKHQFMDGFSSCLQKAACFLSDEGKARGLDFSNRYTVSASDPALCVEHHPTASQSPELVQKAVFTFKCTASSAAELCLQTRTSISLQQRCATSKQDCIRKHRLQHTSFGSQTNLSTPDTRQPDGLEALALREIKDICRDSKYWACVIIRHASSHAEGHVY